MSKVTSAEAKSKLNPETLALVEQYGDLDAIVAGKDVKTMLMYGKTVIEANSGCGYIRDPDARVIADNAIDFGLKCITYAADNDYPPAFVYLSNFEKQFCTPANYVNSGAVSYCDALFGLLKSMFDKAKQDKNVDDMIISFYNCKCEVAAEIFFVLRNDDAHHVEWLRDNFSQIMYSDTFVDYIINKNLHKKLPMSVMIDLLEAMHRRRKWVV